MAENQKQQQFGKPNNFYSREYVPRGRGGSRGRPHRRGRNSHSGYFNGPSRNNNYVNGAYNNYWSGDSNGFCPRTFPPSLLPPPNHSHRRPQSTPTNGCSSACKSLKSETKSQNNFHEASSDEEIFLELARVGNILEFHDKLDDRQHIQLSQLALDAALLLTSSRGFKFAVQTLVGMGASLLHRNYAGNTALLLASENGHIEIMKYLINKKSNVNASNNSGNTALLLCIRSAGSADMIRFLLSQGANCNTSNKSGVTPLMKATEMRDVDAMKVLVEAGASKSFRNNSFCPSAQDIAKSGGLEDVFDVLSPRTKKNKAKSPNSLLTAVKSLNVHVVRMLLDCEHSDVNLVPLRLPTIL